MAGRRGLGTSALWNLAGIVVFTASQWAILIVLAKAGRLHTVGLVALGLAVSAPVFFFFDLGLRQVLAADAKCEYSPQLYLRVRLISSSCGLLVILASTLLFWSSPEHRAVIMFVGVAKAVGSVTELCYGLLQKVERFDLVARSLIARGLGAVGAVAVGFHWTGRVEVAVAAWAAAWCVMLLVHDYPLFRRYADRNLVLPDATDAGRLVRQAIPLGVAGMLVMFNLNIPRYWLAQLHGEAMLGVFAAAAAIPISGRRILEAFGQTAMPRLSQHWAADRVHAFRRLLLGLVGLGTACSGLGLLISSLWAGPILAWVYTADYAAHSSILIWLMGSFGLRYPSAFLMTGIVATRRFNVGPRIYAPSVIATLLGAALLIPRYGILGAVWADLISASLQLALTLFFSRYLWSSKARR